MTMTAARHSTSSATVPAGRRPRRAWLAAGLLTVGVTGGGAYAVLQDSSSTSSSSTTSAVATQVAGGAAPGGSTGTGGSSQGAVLSSTATTMAVRLSSGATRTYTVTGGGTALAVTPSAA
jgi:hypothetical protein